MSSHLDWRLLSFKETMSAILQKDKVFYLREESMAAVNQTVIDVGGTLHQ